MKKVIENSILLVLGLVLLVGLMALAVVGLGSISEDTTSQLAAAKAAVETVEIVKEVPVKETVEVVKEVPVLQTVEVIKQVKVPVTTTVVVYVAPNTPTPTPSPTPTLAPSATPKATLPATKAAPINGVVPEDFFIRLGAPQFLEGSGFIETIARNEWESGVYNIQTITFQKGESTNEVVAKALVDHAKYVAGKFGSQNGEVNIAIKYNDGSVHQVSGLQNVTWYTDSKGRPVIGQR